MGNIAKFSEGGSALGGISNRQNMVRIGQKIVQMLIKSEIYSFSRWIRTGKEKNFSVGGHRAGSEIFSIEGGIGQGGKNFK